MWTLATFWACGGDDPTDKAPADDTIPPDTDADTDTDTDVDLHTAHTGTFTTSTGEDPDGPMAPGWYRLNSLYFYNLGIPVSPNGQDSGRRDTGSTAPPDTFWPRYVAFGTNFGWDGDGNMVPVGAGPYGVFPPTLFVTLATDAYLDGSVLESDWCSYEIPLEGAWTELSVSAGRLWWGYEWDGSTAIGGNCNTGEWPLEPFYWGDPAVDWPLSSGIGFAVGEPTQETVELTAGVIDEPFLLGGTFRFPPLLGQTPDPRVFGSASVVDPLTMELALNGNYVTLIERADLYPYP